ncbi:MAG: hypothetical protein PVF47_15550, partial [Anaerolineae bacterium]
SLAGDLVKKPIDEAVETARTSLQPPKVGGKKGEAPAAVEEPASEPVAQEEPAGEAASRAPAGEEAITQQVAAQKETEPIDVGALSQAVAAAMTRLSAGQEGDEAPEIEAPVEEKSDE